MAEEKLPVENYRFVSSEEPESSSNLVGALIILAILFYFFAPLSWKTIVQDKSARFFMDISLRIRPPTPVIENNQTVELTPTDRAPTATPIPIFENAATGSSVYIP